MNKKIRIVLYGHILLIAILPRVLDLGAILSPDEPQWERNTQGFLQGLKAGDAKLLYQQPHPGITTQWVSVLTIHSSSWAVKRLPIALFVSVVIAVVTYLINRLWNEPYGFFAGLLVAIDPLFIAHSRVLAMDSLLGIFLLLSMIGLLLWQKEYLKRWLIMSAVAASLAVLSKVSGIIIVPFAIIFITLVCWRRRLSLGSILMLLVVWLGVVALTAVIVLPTMLTDFEVVRQGTQTFFASEHFQQAVHALGPWWYPRAVLIWSTPVGIMAIIGLPFLWRQEPAKRFSLIALLLFASLFFAAMQYSIKKGDRYLLPSFLLWDVVAASVVAWFTTHAYHKKNSVFKVGASILLMATLWQGVTLVQLHPYALAYRNPWFRSLASGRTMGWGEGLDLAADYLNQKPNAKELLVISYYESSFMHRFVGSVTSAERLAGEGAHDIGANYVVLYRTMQGRAPERWETKVLATYANKKPEHVIKLNGEAYVWIYPVK